MKSNKVPQAANCPDVRVSVNGTAYRLVISSRLYEDKRQRFVGLGIRCSDNNALLDAHTRQIQLQTEINNFEYDPTLQKYKDWKKVKIRYSGEKLTLGKLWDNYCDYKKPLLAESTYKQKYRRTFLYAIIDIGQQLPVTHDTAIYCRNWLLENRSKADTIYLLYELEKAVEMAIKTGKHIDRNSFFGLGEQVKKLKNREIDTRTTAEVLASINGKKAYTAIERDKILDYFLENSPKFYLFTYFRFFTGCRFGEAIELRWSDFTEDFSTVLFRRSYSEISKKVQTTKTGKERKFNLSAAVSEKMAEAWEGAVSSEDELVFTNTEGGRISNWQYRRYWKNAITALHKAGEISCKLSLNHTRHTLISIARQSNSAEAVAAQLGHNVSTQNEHYLDNSNERESVLSLQ